MAPKAFLNLLLKGGEKNESVKNVSTATVASVPKNKIAKISTTLYTKELDFEQGIVKGVHIQFMSEEELKKISVVNVKHDEKEEKKGNLQGTISDPRMYPNFGSLCSSCVLPRGFCPGHLGMIKLVKPVINIWAYKYVFSVLESICHKCGTLLLDIETAKNFGKNPTRLKKIADASKGLPCRNKSCPNFEQKNYDLIKKSDSVLKVQLKLPGNQTSFISSSEIFNLFNNLNNEELEALGFPQNTLYSIHPKNMLFTALPIIPENHRPPVVFDGKTQPNILTSIYHKIIAINNLLSSNVKNDRMNLGSLEDEICSIHQKKSEATENSNDSSKNIFDILSKKSGLIRANIQAKRCDHTGRTVLTPGGLTTPFGWMTLPKGMSKILIEEVICDHNIDYYTKMLENGKISTIITKDQKIDASKRLSNFVLKKGMIVKRPLQTGDPIMFNRNPTLSKYSMMGYIARLDNSEKLTIGLHSSNCSPHNADFDGDEGNFHVSSSYKARAEIIHISGCWNNIMGTNNSSPKMGLDFNTILSAYLISRYGTIEDNFWNFVMDTVLSKSSRLATLKERVKKHRPKDRNWKTGPALFSALLPENFYYNHAKVLIKEGILIEGTLNKSVIGASTRSIVHMLYHYYGTQLAAQFISEGQFLLDLFVEHIGFSMGYSDCIMPGKTDKVQEIVKKEMDIAGEKLKELAPLISDKNKEIRDFYDQSVEATINTISTIGKNIITEALSDTNSLKILVDSGTKGSISDIAEILGIVGQQFLRDNQRPGLHFNKVVSVSNEGLRFLPHYDIQHDNKPEKIVNRGFIDRNRNKGILPGQFFAIMMASRIGEIDTALSTAKTGYQQHVIIKALEDVRYGYNGTICSDIGQVIQYAGGEDSYETTELMEVKVPGYSSIWSPIDIPYFVEMLNSED